MFTESHILYLFDFADVLSLPQKMDVFFKMGEYLKFDKENFKSLYWQHRRPYDLGESGSEYWTRVSGKKLSQKDIDTLVHIDCESWININPEMRELIKVLKERKLTIGILSNLPIELINVLRNDPIVSEFDFVYFSAEINMVKPDKNIYEYVVARTGFSPSNILFFDDKTENLESAAKLGYKTYLVKPGSSAELLQNVRESKRS